MISNFDLAERRTTACRAKAPAKRMGLTIMDPTDESVAIERALAPRSPLENATIGLIDIRKARGDVFLDQLEARLTEMYPSATVLRLAKPTFTKPAPAEFLDEVSATCDVAIEALAD